MNTENWHGKVGAATTVTTNKIEAPLMGSNPEQVRDYIAKRIEHFTERIKSLEADLVSAKQELKNWKKFKLESAE